MPLSDLQVLALVGKYSDDRHRYELMAAAVAEQLRPRLQEERVAHLLAFRGKEPSSLEKKLRRDGKAWSYELLVADFAPTIVDLAGVRVLLYRPGDVDRVCRIVEDVFTVPEGERYRRDHKKRGGYKAKHRVVTLPLELVAREKGLDNLRGALCEVQVVTVVDHVWNELEHDIIYKTPKGKPSGEQTIALRILRGQLDAVQHSVKILANVTEKRVQENLEPIESPEDLRRVLYARHEQAISGDFAGLWRLLVAMLLALTPAALDELPLKREDWPDARARLARLHPTAWNDDVSRILAALWPTYADEFVEVVGSWRGRPGPVARLVHALDKARQEVTI